MNPVALWLRIALGVLGVGIVALVLDAAVRTFLLPRVASVRLSRAIAKSVSAFFHLIGGSRNTYAQLDRRLSLYPSVLLLSYQATWLGLMLVAFACLFMSAGAPSAARAFELSGSSLFTLGTTASQGGGQQALSYLEAGIGLTLLALLIAFIPTLYAAFQRREVSVSRLTVRAGVPATPWGVLEIAQSVDSYERLDELWREWESWFIEIGETHTTLPILNFYRTSIPGQTWIGSAAAVLDAAALYNSAVDRPASPTAGLCIRSGWLTLRALANYFKVPYHDQSDRAHAIAISRDEFEAVLDRLARSGVPLLADHDAAWQDFVGWRVNYDAMIEAFHVLFTCPRTDWSLSSSEPLVEPSNRRGLHRHSDDADPRRAR
jgi:hypothetical protein